MIPKQLQMPEINFVLIEPKGKKPFEKDWQKKEIKFDDIKLIEHISSNGNYGVRGGGNKNLIIVDFDNEQVQEEVIKMLPETLTIKTGGGLLHKYFFSNKCDSFKIFDENMDTITDVQGEGKQVVGAGSEHPNGNKYSLVEDKEIAFIEYSELKATLMKYDKKPKKEIKQSNLNNKEFNNNFLEEVKRTIKPVDVLSDSGVDTSKNPTACPFHFSKGGKCMGWNDETIHCFHCEGSWNIFSWIMEDKKCDFKEALNYLVKLGGLEKEYEKQKINFGGDKELNKIVNYYFSKQDLAKQILKIQPMYYDEYKNWWVWDKHEYKWCVKDDVDILNFVNILSSANTINSKHKAEILESLKQTSRKWKPKPIKETWIQFKETIVDIETGEEMKVSPEYFVTNPIPYNLDKERFMNTPNIDRIFEEWVGSKYVKTLYEIIAYCLIPSYPIHRIFCFIGSGMNGKSKFLELLRKFIGDKNCCSTELDTLLTSRFEVTRLHKKLVCQMGETNFNEMNKTSMLKKLSGGDLIGFEYKRKDPFEEKNYAKIIIATNSLPTTTDKTIGFYRRWAIIDFPNQFSEEKDILSEIPNKEYEALAVKCIIILKDLMDKRNFHNEGTIEERREKYESKSNFLELFLEKFTMGDIDGFITKADFYKQFKEWCKENRHREMSETSVGLSMRELGVDNSRKHFDWMFDGKGGQARIWIGIKWRSD